MSGGLKLPLLSDSTRKKVKAADKDPKKKIQENKFLTLENIMQATLEKIKDERLEKTLYSHSSCVNSVVISSDSKYIVSGSRDNSIKV